MHRTTVDERELTSRFSSRANASRRCSPSTAPSSHRRRPTGRRLSTYAELPRLTQRRPSAPMPLHISNALSIQASRAPAAANTPTEALSGPRDRHSSFPEPRDHLAGDSTEPNHPARRRSAPGTDLCRLSTPAGGMSTIGEALHSPKYRCSPSRSSTELPNCNKSDPIKCASSVGSNCSTTRV